MPILNALVRGDACCVLRSDRPIHHVLIRSLSRIHYGHEAGGKLRLTRFSVLERGCLFYVGLHRNSTLNTSKEKQRGDKERKELLLELLSTANPGSSHYGGFINRIRLSILRRGAYVN